jgi:hypothetical protein
MEKGELVEFPEQPAVYAVYNKDDQIQYIGLTRKVSFDASCMDVLQANLHVTLAQQVRWEAVIDRAALAAALATLYKMPPCALYQL